MTTDSTDPVLEAELAEIADVAERAARAAGRELLARHRTDLAIETKTNRHDMVSEADREAQAAALAVITAHRPDDGLLGEEEGLSHATDARFVWVIDPLDGTTNFLRGYPDWSVSIGILENGIPAVGIVYDASRDTMYRAIRGQGATREGHPLHVTDIDAVDGALIEIGLSYEMEIRQAQWTGYTRLLELGAMFRSAGSAAMSLARVAEGVTDVFIDDDLSLWDWAAGVVLVSEAGGTWQELPTLGRGYSILASAPGVHVAVTEAIRH